jgi:hypothetical protein
MYFGLAVGNAHFKAEVRDICNVRDGHEIPKRLDRNLSANRLDGRLNFASVLTHSNGNSNQSLALCPHCLVGKRGTLQAATNDYSKRPK